MTDIGYHEPVPGIYGTANPATDSDPISRAALQAKYAQMQIDAASRPGAVPASYERLGGGNVATVGWTAQNGAGAAFPPYSNEHIGRIPDWTDDANPNGGGYDMNPSWGAEPRNPLNRAPIGDSADQGAMGVAPPPNPPMTDVGGSIDLEW